jgi:hypothetical protein
MRTIVIGADVHKSTHALAAIDAGTGQLLGERVLRVAPKLMGVSRRGERNLASPIQSTRGRSPELCCARVSSVFRVPSSTRTQSRFDSSVQLYYGRLALTDSFYTRSGSVPPGQKESSTSTRTVSLSASNTASTCMDSIRRTIRMFERLRPPSSPDSRWQQGFGRMKRPLPATAKPLRRPVQKHSRANRPGNTSLR